MLSVLLMPLYASLSLKNLVIYTPIPNDFQMPEALTFESLAKDIKDVKVLVSSFTAQHEDEDKEKEGKKAAMKKAEEEKQEEEKKEAKKASALKKAMDEKDPK